LAILGRNFLLAGVEDQGSQQLRYNALPKSDLCPDAGINGYLRDLFNIRLGSQNTVLVPNLENYALRNAYGYWSPSHTTKRVVADMANTLSVPNAKIEQVLDPIQYDVGSRHLVAFGFETSQPLYRQVAGYLQLDRERSEFQGYERYSDENPFDLPWKSNLGSAAAVADPNEFYLRTIEKTGEHFKRRIWSLSHQGTTLRPEFSEGRCRIDYISIIHIPIFLALSHEYTMTLIAGIQAAGTEAVGKLINDKGLLKRIERDIPGASSWQAIIRADVRDRDMPKFTLYDVSPIGVSMSILDKWRNSPPSF
jgi:hypothetical protein